MKEFGVRNFRHSKSRIRLGPWFILIVALASLNQSAQAQGQANKDTGQTVAAAQPPSAGSACISRQM